MTDVRENMARELESAVNNQVKQQVMDKLGDLHEFHLPKAVVQREIDALKEQMLGQFQMTGPGPKPDLPNELFQEQAEKRVKVGLVVNEVIRSESLVVDQAMLDARLEDISSQYGEPEQVISWYRSNPDQLQNIEMGVLEEQVVQHIMTQSQVEVVECSYADAISGKAVEVKEEPSADNTATET
jgi:trigger factor